MIEDKKQLSNAEKILQLNNNDLAAVQTKVTALIKLDRYKDAIDFIHSLQQELQFKFYFETSYCLYKLNNLEGALLILNKVNDHDHNLTVLNLKAQIYYKKEDYIKCSQVYNQLLDTTPKDDDHLRELEANCNACFFNLVLNDINTLEAALVKEEETYEIQFNLGLVRSAQGKFDEAERLLLAAQTRCREELTDEEYSEDEIKKELAIIVAQLAFCYQMKGKYSEALEIYEGILNSKQSDLAVSAVASNNMMAIKNDSELFDSLKKHRHILTSDVEAKLTKQQKKLIAINGAILAMKMGKNNAKDLAKNLASTYPENEIPPLILAGLSYKQKKIEKCNEELKSFLESNPKSLSITLALAQFQIQQNNLKKALRMVEDYFDLVTEDLKFKPGLISLLVWLNVQSGNLENAVKVLEEATEYWKQSCTEYSGNNESILQQLALFKLQSNKAKDAAKDFELLVKKDPKNLTNVAHLVLCYIKYDFSLAEKYSNYLDEALKEKEQEDDLMNIEENTDLENLDFDFLESGVGLFKKKLAGLDSSKSVTKVNKKRKRKILLPKNYDPNVKPDPERWIPKRDRTNVKKQKGKKNQDQRIGGPQGVNMAGGGIGGTGSIGNLKSNSNSPTSIPPSVEKSVSLSSSPNSGVGKRKKKGRK